MYGSCPYGARKGLPPVPRTRAPSARPVAEGSLLGKHWKKYGYGNTCTNDDDLTAYMNDPAVIAALHVGAKSGAWAECGGVQYSRDVQDERETIYPALLAAKLHIVIYNGEADACVPITDNQWCARPPTTRRRGGRHGARARRGAALCDAPRAHPARSPPASPPACLRRWTDSLNLPTITPWTSWQASDGTAGGKFNVSPQLVHPFPLTPFPPTHNTGYITTYQAPGSFAFVTIRGAGHMVPQVQPLYALDFARSAIVRAHTATRNTPHRAPLHHTPFLQPPPQPNRRARASLPFPAGSCREVVCVCV